MKLEINIQENIYNQFSRQLDVSEHNGSLELKSNIGEGNIRLRHFPNTLEFYHFTFKLNQELQLFSTNPIDSDYLLLNINLSEKAVEKKVNGAQINIQRYLPTGILYYPPNINVASLSPIDTPFEIVLIKFNKNLLSTYFEETHDFVATIKDTIIYEDLDFSSEELIRQIINSEHKLKCHSYLLAFLSIFFDKLKLRESQIKYENLHPQDIKQLFLAAALLRNPTADDIPSVDDLAQMANMGKTKFKNTFKQVFGNAPKQYHQKIKMEYAKGELQKSSKTSSEIAYELGYSHPSKFTRAFRNYFGNSPSKI